MAMEIAGIIGQSVRQKPLPGDHDTPRMPTLTEQAARHEKNSNSTVARTRGTLETLVSDVQNVVSALDKRLQFSINRELGQVVVKVIDRSTDKVIKELPPEELQRLHVRIREAIGLLIDEEI